jgi:hypothetical protein
MVVEEPCLKDGKKFVRTALNPDNGSKLSLH